MTVHGGGGADVVADPDDQTALRVRALDASGFLAPTPASWTWTVVLPPDTVIVNAPAHDTFEADATFTFTASESGAMFQCSLNDSAYELCTTPQTYADLFPGLYVFRVRAVVDGIATRRRRAELISPQNWGGS